MSFIFETVFKALGSDTKVEFEFGQMLDWNVFSETKFEFTEFEMTTGVSVKVLLLQFSMTH